ncbi:DNA-directed RNA polymerase specialized sigma24 family protein OS=Streptomyces alboniger OX=132473 GN=CP975_09795 PE=4 SV=1 [Streptomyces alboniger]
MQSQKPKSPSASGPAPVVDVEQAEAALVEHYPRLVRLAYLVLPPALGRNRRVLTAHALTQRALPRSRKTGRAVVIPSQQGGGRQRGAGYAYVRLEVLRGALDAGLPLKRLAWPKRAQLPPLLPQVRGLRLFPRSGGADKLALDQQLAALSADARAAYVLRGLESLDDAGVRATLAAAGCEDPEDALEEADEVDARYALLASPEFDPCSLQARPTDLMRRRQHMKAAGVAVAAALVCGALLGMPGDGWGPDGAAAPPYARNPAGQAALDPDQLTVAAAGAWKRSAREDFSAWPARGSLTGDKALLRRALAVWARPGESVQVSATPGTASGAPPGPAQLLYAGEVDAARVVLLYDGLRIVRYAEPREGTGGAALDFARVDGATGAEANAVVVNRADGNIRYLTAPWITSVSVSDLLKPAGPPSALKRGEDGVTAAFAGPPATGRCTSWNALRLREASGTVRTSTDLGELTPARLTAGRPGAPREAGPADWAKTACSLASVRSNGVRSVNSWQYARQALPEAGGVAQWVCTRADTWRGAGNRTLAQFQTAEGVAGAVAAKAEDSLACGARDAKVLAGVLWKSRAGNWYILGAGSKNVTSVTASGGGSVQGNLLAARTERSTQARLTGTLADGTKVNTLR